jgi:hypothetical protein
MPRPEPTEIRINEYGDEEHESWLLVGAHKISGGTRLFDSEISHQHWIRVHVSRCSRKRDLKHDWLHQTDLICEFDMSEAQWGAFVSSFGHGTGVPATLTFLQGVGMVPEAPFESRLAQSVKEVHEAGKESMQKVQESYERLQAAFDRGAGKKEMRELLMNHKYVVQNVPANMKFAADSLTEHAENVVTKAKADIEAMVLRAEEGAKQLKAPNPFMLGEGS